MKSFTYVITDAQGIHARPAGLLVKAASTYESKITISKDKKEVDAKRIIGIMGLGIKAGETVTVSIDGPDEAEAVVVLEKFFQENL